jgi:hypothetical protein
MKSRKKPKTQKKKIIVVTQSDKTDEPKLFFGQMILSKGANQGA